MSVQLQKRQWYYDASGHYSYIMLDASEQILKNVEQILEQNRLRVLLSGKSFKPASNGVQYNYYIRVADKYGKHPSSKRIYEIISPYEVADEESHQIKVLSATLENQRQEIKNLKDELSDKARQNEVIAEQSKIIAKQNQQIRSSYDDAQLEIRKYRNELLHIQDKYIDPKDLDEFHCKYQQTIDELNNKLDTKEKELFEWIEKFEPDLVKRDQKIWALENQNEIINQENERLKNESHTLEAIPTNLAKKNDLKLLFNKVLSILLPDIEFLKNSFDTLWSEMQNTMTIKALEKVKNLERIRGKKVQGTIDWFEGRIGTDWRIYYRRCKSSKYQVLISPKKTQKEDINWLKEQSYAS